MSDLLEITAKDWHINQTIIPPEDSSEYDAYYEYHRKLCIDGCYVGGVYIPGYLYWHLNFWKVDVDLLNENGRIDQKYTNPLLRDNEWIIFNAILEAEKQHKGLAIGGGRRIAKDLLNSSKLYTEEGYHTIGDAKIGQRIYDRNGELTTIKGVFPQGKRPVYKITLRDSRELFCGLDHNWIVENKNNKEQVLTTRQLMEKMSKTNPFYIPLTSCVNYPKRNLLIDPYVLGYHLGDGDKGGGRFATLDYEPIEEYRKNYEVTDLGDDLHYYAKGLATDMRTLGIYDNKYIPDEYLYSSEEQRYSLLAGLLDSDGSVCVNKRKDGKLKSSVVFTNTNKRIVDGFISVVYSLGGVAYTSLRKGRKRKGNICKDSYEVSITGLDINRLFRIKRKREKIIPKVLPVRRIPIKSIEYVFDAETTCIMVDNEGCDFLTDDYTVTHNSSFLSSYIGHGVTFDRDSQNVVAGLNSDDIGLLTDKISKSLDKVDTPFKWQRIEENWKSKVTFGAKDKNRKKYPFSQILIRNLDNGLNEEAIAGTKPRKLVIDESGKSNFLKCLQAARPGFTTRFGWACSPIIAFTAGDMKTYHDAKELFFNCDAYNFLEFKDEKKNRVHGLFMGAKYRQEGKVDSTLAEYLNQPENESLRELHMLVSDEELAFSVTEKSLEELRKSGDRKAYLKEQMYFPKEVDDMFVSDSGTIFNANLAKKQRLRLEEEGIKGSNVELSYDGESIKWHFSEKTPVTEYPLRSQSKDAPVVIYEHPVKNPPFGLYVAGVDSYSGEGDSVHSDSLGAVYIFKRIHNITGEGFQNMIVASYVARPENREDWQENARLLIKYYNAYALVENNEMSFIDYMKNKGDAQKHLAPQPSWLKIVTPYSTQNKTFGVSRSGKNVINFLYDLQRKYMKEVIDVNKSDDGSVISEILGVSRIMDIALLKETELCTGEENVDRIVAFSLALALANDLDNTGLNISNADEDPRLRSYFNKDKKTKKGKSTIFTFKNNVFR